MIGLVIFDWDGTLMDSHARIVHALGIALREHAKHAPQVAAIRAVIGMDLQQAIKQLRPGLQQAQITAIADTYRNEYEIAVTPPTPLFAGAHTTLERLTSAGLLLAVATSKSRAGLALAMRESGVADYFAATVTAGESAPKPDPSMLYGILEQCRIARTDALMVGDSVFDLRMAQAAGIKCAAALYGAHDEQCLLDLAPDLTINALSELPAALVQIERKTTD